MASTYTDTADLELLVELAQTGSLAKAASALKIHHATAFRRLGDLEKRAGAPMFERRPRGYVPTAAAGRLLASARRLRAEMRDFDAQLRDLDTHATSALRVTTSDGLAASFLPLLLRAFHDAHPDIAVDLIVENRLMNVADREVDIALRPAREVSGDMVCRRVATMGYTLYASKEYVHRHGSLEPKAPSFRGHTVCAFSESVAYFTTAKWLQRHARDARVAAECNSLTTMQGMARSGMCIAALPCVVGDGDPLLVSLLPPIEAMETSLWVCTHKRLRKVARVRAFLDFFYAAVEKRKPQLAGRRQ